MAHIVRWVEVACDYKDCDWYSDTLTPGETKVCWAQYREHKREAHPKQCGKCPYIDSKYLCRTKGCTEAKKHKEVE